VRWFRGRRTGQSGASGGSTHGTAPTIGTVPDDVLQAVNARRQSEYSIGVKHLGDQLRGRVVTESIGGHSGYLLRFADGTWVAVWLEPSLSRMAHSIGAGDPPAEVVALLSNPVVASASAPLDMDLPYASEDNDISAEARHTHGKPITGVAIGEQDFSLCFPGDMELEGPRGGTAAVAWCFEFSMSSGRPAPRG
jgi:hypothetical protein